ncbi:hypothetical protein C8Q74DRAFT_1257898 [Fomes fomentarius]|nr:hypothetical protein C8Q74DRAFT_1257898 [Fomes fomentarius]
MQLLNKYSKGNAQLSMKLLTVDDSHKFDGVVVDGLKKVLTQLSPSKKETIDDLFERSWPSEWQEVRVSIHAGAALMGAAYLEVEDSENLKRPTMRIGVSKKCCFCCWLLGSELNKWRMKGDAKENRSRHPEVVLPGSHSTVYPCLPPPGVPAEVLKIIRAELLMRLWELIQEGMEPRSKSAQTSRTRSVRLPDCDMGELLLRLGWQ